MTTLTNPDCQAGKHHKCDELTGCPCLCHTVVYLSGPMTGYEEFNYPAFNRVADELRARGVRVLNPVDSERLNVSGAPQAWDWYMRHALRMLLDASAVCMLPGWETSRGARIERDVARALKLDVRELDAWMELPEVSA